MKETQFRVLYKQFLFRMVDLELLSADAQGDLNKLFGQFAALLIFISIGLCLGAGIDVRKGSALFRGYEPGRADERFRDCRCAGACRAGS